MVFSSEIFLYAFIPIYFSLYYLIPVRCKNWLILAGSLLFYAVGAGSAVLVLVGSIWVNQYLAVRIEPASEPRRKTLLATGVILNLLGIAFYKYATFLWQLTSDAILAVGLHALPAAPFIPLPIGIACFT